ncbi:hypothetical protein QWY81_17745 [Polaribacter undariae]|uniref:Uncharacterized protein n=2 Tax=Polaribacter sejongensis TaxID=985043 RepID=A0AAJ1R018_9FLAO|nr:hypothetical protein [Polaribacter undariae]MDN3621315.1 hypothetical protein [Polaribacter undariae]UWD31857.1 hypothetical protein NQP51_17210 [Polaribacter undariae]
MKKRTFIFTVIYIGFGTTFTTEVVGETRSQAESEFYKTHSVAAEILTINNK